MFVGGLLAILLGSLAAGPLYAAVTDATVPAGQKEAIIERQAKMEPEPFRKEGQRQK